MSYCVNCGVELKASEPACPLCGVEVVNPAKPWKEPEARPYPPYLETVMRGVDRRYFSALAALLGLIPVLVCVLVDIFTSGEMLWSGYVVGAAVIALVAVLFPIGYGRSRPFLYLGCDVLAVLAYLLYIDLHWDGTANWFTTLAMPLVLSCALVIAATLLYRKMRRKKAVLVTLAVMLFGAGVLTVLVEFFVRLYQQRSLVPVWSFYALVPCVLSGVAFLILNRRRQWKESVRKRLFF